MSNNVLTQRPEWAALQAHKDEIAALHLRDMFAADAARFDKFHITLEGLLFDYSKHNITDETLEKLCALAKACDVEDRRDAMVSGAAINISENRAALHMALRGSTDDDLVVDGENVTDFVDGALSQIKSVSAEIRTNSQITDVVNIGIGGSDLGPRMVYKALKPRSDGPNVYYISNVDGAALDQRLKTLNPANTLFIIASKTFTTLETLSNAQTAKNWLLGSIDEDALCNHLIAVTANDKAALEFGVEQERILPMREWVGGRYSLWGAIGLSIAISNGFDAFSDFLDGARAADKHFIETPLEKNIPVIMALLGIWYRNFWNYGAQAILPYSHDLRDLPKYLQQLDMESNGKSVDLNGQTIDYATGPVIFGEAGTNAQHAFMQLLHQGPDIIPADFVGIANPEHTLTDHHVKLLGNMLAQSKALMEGQDSADTPHKNSPGNRPSSTLILERLDAYHLGMLLALYEHKIFVQGTIWNINSFDQWGVELGKVIAKDTIQAIENKNENTPLDSSTQNLRDYLTQKFIKS